MAAGRFELLGSLGQVIKHTNLCLCSVRVHLTMAVLVTVRENDAKRSMEDEHDHVQVDSSPLAFGAPSILQPPPPRGYLLTSTPGNSYRNGRMLRGPGASENNRRA